MERESWKSRTGFLLAAVGSAIGLGNIWRFPYMAYKNGGGAFLIPYIVALFVCGIPILILEFAIGHKLRGSAPSVFERVKSGKKSTFQMLGWVGVTLAMFGIQVFYCVVIGWCVYYLVAGFGFVDISKISSGKFFGNLIGSGGFFDFNAPEVWLLLAIIVVWILNLFFVFKGVEKGLERANKIFMPLLAVIVVILMIRSFMLPGAMKGIKAYLIPKFDKLTDINVWKSAFSQIFFTLSLSFGIMIVYASYLPRRSKIKRSALQTALINCGFSFIVGFFVFAVIGYLAFVNGKPVDKVVTKSVGLAFVTFPTAIQKMGGLKNVFWILFFLCLLFAGLSSSLSLLEAFVSSVKDKFGSSREKTTIITVSVGFILSILFALKGAGINWLDAVDHAMNNYGLVLTGILNCVVLGWAYKAKVLRRHITVSDGIGIGKWWVVMVKYVTPSVLTVIFVWGLIFTFMKKSLTYVLVGWGWFLVMILAAFLLSRSKWKNTAALKLGHSFEDEDNPLPYS